MVKKKYPTVQFLAEVYSPWEGKLQSQGFDFTYDKQLYDHLVDGNLDNLRGFIKGNSLSYHSHSAHFVENHDEPRAASKFGNNMRADAAAMISMTLPGMRFYFDGQSHGYFNRLDVHLRRALSEKSNYGVGTFYSNLTNILSRPIFQAEWTYYDVFGTDDSWRLVAWEWHLGNTKALCVINYSDKTATGNIILPRAQPVDDNDNIPLSELFSGTVYTRSASQLRSEGLFVVVEYWSMQIFEYQ